MATLLRKLKGKRVVRVFLFLGIAAGVFLLLQVFAFKMLTKSGSKGYSLHSNIHTWKTEEDGLLKSIHDLKEGYKKLVGIKTPKEKQFTKTALNSSLGVKPSLVGLYVPDNRGMFTCLYSKEVIDYRKVNDDYCDCDDSTDEPGTAACSSHTDTRFYCRFQVLETELLLILSNRVNDGICDCCDGSDEWGEATVPLQNQIKGGSAKSSIFHAPCYDRCDELRAAKEEKERAVEEGRIIKQQYIEYAKGQPHDGKDYGPEDVFRKLENICLSYSSSGFDYNICPFKSVKQQEFPRSTRVLGRIPEWVSKGTEGVWSLRLKAGDKDLCPGTKHRQVLIEFQCGIKEDVITVREPEKCRYEVIMRTPAAC